jgi:hypothetical protein
MPPARSISIHGRRPAIGELAEQATDDLGAGAVVVHGGHEVGEAVAEVVHLPVQALDVAARLLEQLRRRRLHAQYFTSRLISFVTSIDATYARMYVGWCGSVSSGGCVPFLCSECNARTYLAAATAAARAGEQGLEPGDELVDLLLRDSATRPPVRHRWRRECDRRTRARSLPEG